MKKKIQSILQKLLGFENYLYYFARIKISFFKGRTYEAEFFEFLNLIPEGTILDIGANIGITTVPLAKKFPGARIHAFEPIPANNSALKKIINHYRLTNVQLHEMALGEEEGTLKLVVPVINNVRMQGLSHVYVEGQQDEWNTGDIYNIPVTVLDDIPQLQNEHTIAAIKIDVENYEYYVLKGGMQLLMKHKPVIYCELWANEKRALVMDLLKECGYSVKVFEGKQLTAYTNQPVTNFIFVCE
ncbi:MAG TPA: FkbM family methyltransferase [Chitinophagaceae bacterium]|nr:FkbM family methyltransferase [Chitinophagaceae bacterium]